MKRTYTYSIHDSITDEYLGDIEMDGRDLEDCAVEEWSKKLVLLPGATLPDLDNLYANFEGETEDDSEIDDEYRHRRQVVADVSRICGGLTSSEVRDIMAGD